MNITIKNRFVPAMLCLLLFLSGSAYSQDNLIFLGRNTPQKFMTNPALVPDNARFFISVPVIGGLNANVSGNISYSHIFSMASGKKATINVPHLLKHLDETTRIRSILNLDVLNMGFRISRTGFMGITLRGRTSVDMGFSKDAVSFIMDNPLERTGIFDIRLTPDALSWGELGISYSQRLSRNFTAGIRIKGVAGGVSAQAASASIEADKTLTRYMLRGDIDMRTGNLNLTGDGEKKYNIRHISPGFGIDLGISYTSDNKRITAYASLSDFGRIYWNEKSSSRIISVNPAARYEWVGIKDLDGLIDGNKSFKEVFENTFDEMTAAVGMDTVKTTFTSNLPATIQIGGKYALDRKLMHSISLNSLTIIPQFAKTYYEFTAGYTYSSANKRWDIMGAYTYKSIHPFNIGIGGLYRGRGFEIFLMTDSINSFFDYKAARSANIRLGMNFYCPLRYYNYKHRHKHRNQMIW